MKRKSKVETVRVPVWIARLDKGHWTACYPIGTIVHGPTRDGVLTELRRRAWQDIQEASHGK